MEIQVAPPPVRVVAVPAARRGERWAPAHWEQGRAGYWHFEPGHWER